MKVVNCGVAIRIVYSDICFSGWSLQTVIYVHYKQSWTVKCSIELIYNLKRFGQHSQKICIELWGKLFLHSARNQVQ